MIEASYPSVKAHLLPSQRWERRVRSNQQAKAREVMLANDYNKGDLVTEALERTVNYLCSHARSPKGQELPWEVWQQIVAPEAGSYGIRKLYRERVKPYTTDEMLEAATQLCPSWTTARASDPIFALAQAFDRAEQVGANGHVEAVFQFTAYCLRLQPIGSYREWQAALELVWRSKELSTTRAAILSDRHPFPSGVVRPLGPPLLRGNRQRAATAANSLLAGAKLFDAPTARRLRQEVESRLVKWPVSEAPGSDEDRGPLSHALVQQQVRGDLQATKQLWKCAKKAASMCGFVSPHNSVDFRNSSWRKYLMALGEGELLLTESSLQENRYGSDLMKFNLLTNKWAYPIVQMKVAPMGTLPDWQAVKIMQLGRLKGHPKPLC